MMKMMPRSPVVVFLFFAAIASSVTHTLWADDVWWHLKSGEWIFKHQAVPRIDPFSYTVPDHPWIDLSWGFQLFLYIAYHLGGIPGIILFKVGIVTLTFFFLFRHFSRKLPLLFILPVLVMALFASHERLIERPEVASFLFLVLTLLFLENERLKPTKRAFFLPLLQLFWVNFHSLFILGLLAIAANALGSTLTWALAKDKKRVPFPMRGYLLLGLSLLATGVNPYGFRGILLPLTLFTRISGEIDFFTRGIGEFARPFAAQDPSLRAFLYRAFLILTPLSFLLNHKRFPPAHALLLILFTFLSLLARRNIAPFVLVASFLILANLEGLLKEAPYLKKPKIPSWGLLALILAFPIPFLTNTFYEEQGFYKRFGLGISEHRYPVRAARFIEQSGLPGNFFNSGLDLGGYFLWRFYPERKVFMDGRLEVYGGTFFRELFELFNDPGLWPEWVKRYKINFCILDHAVAKHEGLLRRLVHDADWRAVYLDGQVIIFLKESPENRPFLEAFALDLEKDPPPSGDWVDELSIADFYGKIGLLDQAEALYRKHLFARPRQAAIYHNLGNLFRRQKEPEEALSLYRQAVRLEPENPIFHFSLGSFYEETGDAEQALRSLKESLRLDTDFGEAHYLLGRYYARKGMWKEAEKAYLRIGRSDTVYLPARNALGILYAETGALDRAEREFREILKKNPASGEALQNLKHLEKLKR